MIFDGVVDDTQEGREQVTINGIAGLLRKEMAPMIKAIQKSQHGFENLDLRLTSLTDAVEFRLNCSRFANPHQPILKQPLLRSALVIGSCRSVLSA